MNIHKQRGVINFRKYMLDSFDKEIFQALFSNFFPVHIYYNHDTDIISYSGLSPFFTEIDEYSVIPEYEVTFTTINSGIKIDFKLKQ